jgi:CheY-like chemotaxis protein
MTTILYVDDHPPARLLMSAIIAELTDFSLLTAATGAEAIEATKSHTPDLYILDVDLPDTDGILLAEHLNRVHTAPVLLVSAYAESIEIDTLPDFIHTYIAKPIDPDAVVETIRRTVA